MNNKQPINVYWAPLFSNDPAELYSKDWNMMYSDPVEVFSDLIKNKNPLSGRESFFSCPAVRDRMRTSFVFKNNLKTKVEYDFSDELNPKAYASEGIFANYYKPSAIIGGANISFSMKWLFFSEEPLITLTNPAFFHKPTEFSLNGLFPSGKFDASKWFRPVSFEMQIWKNVGSFIIDEDDPLFYVEFLTDRPIILKRFVVNQQLFKYANACSTSHETYGINLPLIQRYNRFINTKTNKLVLKEIQNNLID